MPPLVSQPAFCQQGGKAVQEGMKPFCGASQRLFMGMFGHDRVLRVGGIGILVGAKTGDTRTNDKTRQEKGGRASSSASERQEMRDVDR